MEVLKTMGFLGVLRMLVILNYTRYSQTLLLN